MNDYPLERPLSNGPADDLPGDCPWRFTAATPTCGCDGERHAPRAVGPQTPKRDGGEGSFCSNSSGKTNETLPANTPVSDGGEGGRGQGANSFWRHPDPPRVPFPFGGTLPPPLRPVRPWQRASGPIGICRLGCTANKFDMGLGVIKPGCPAANPAEAVTISRRSNQSAGGKIQGVSFYLPVFPVLPVVGFRRADEEPLAQVISAANSLL
jgi:hypothetical protein